MRAKVLEKLKKYYIISLKQNGKFKHYLINIAVHFNMIILYEYRYYEYNILNIMFDVSVSN